MEPRTIILIVLGALLLAISVFAFFSVRQSNREEKYFDGRWHLYHQDEEDEDAKQ